MGTSTDPQVHADEEAAESGLFWSADEHATVVAAIAPARRMRMMEVERYGGVAASLMQTPAASDVPSSRSTIVRDSIKSDVNTGSDRSDP
jgi:hypothetical protein